MSVLSLVISAHSDVTMYLVPSNVSVRMDMHLLQMEDIAAVNSIISKSILTVDNPYY